MITPKKSISLENVPIAKSGKECASAFTGAGTIRNETKISEADVITV
jgi:hypothetical protein